MITVKKHHSCKPVADEFATCTYEFSSPNYKKQETKQRRAKQGKRTELTAA